jgi:uncharacterized protein (DUF302 family)
MSTTVSDRPYGRMVELQTDFDSAIEATTTALRNQGFGVLTTIDVPRVLNKDEIGLERDRYTILGACTPELANRGLEADIDLRLLLPCNVTVREEARRTLVTVVDLRAMLAAAGESVQLEGIAIEVRVWLDAAAESLATV